MATFCRITGNARNLPKPHYFPLLPPISPADAKKLCRITGKAGDPHHFCPIVAFGKPIKFDGVIGCRITMFEGFSFAKPIFVKNKENEKAYDFLDEVMSNMKSRKKKEADVSKLFAYDVQEHKITIVVPPEIEEAIRCGEIETLSLSKDCKMIQLKINSGRIIKLTLEPIPKAEIESSDSIFYGEGQNKDVLAEQQEIINERNKRKQETMARKKLFEDKERKEEESERRDIERPKSKKPLKFTLKKREEKIEKMEKMIKEQKHNKAIVLPKFEPEVQQADPDEVVRYEKMLEDIAMAQRVSHSLVVCATDFDWRDEKAAATGFDWDSFPSEDENVKPIEVISFTVDQNKIISGSHIMTLDIVAAVETIEPLAPPSAEIIQAVLEFKDEKKIKHTECAIETLNEFKCSDVVATFDEIGRIAKNMHRANFGFLVQKDGDTQFVPNSRYVENEGKALSGALVEVDDNQSKKFVTGQIINLADEESFVAGQTVDDEGGKRFVPGHTIVTPTGEIKFIPGHCVKNQEGNSTFLAGQTIDTLEGPKFVPGQMMDRGDGKPVFVPGQTITTTDGPKFVPGDFIKDEDGFDCFVPGLPMPSKSGGEEQFIPGQTFQNEKGDFSFTPGQIVDTVEGPVFVPGKAFKTDKGENKFVKGEIIEEDGKMKFVKKDIIIPAIYEELIIPPEELVPIAIAGKNVVGFVVNPTNTSNIEKGKKLIGDMVETEIAVQFYLTGKMPDNLISEALKIISGQLNVGEEEQRFIPGRMIRTLEGVEKFVPGQLVMTSHGEDFVPGQIVVTQDGPKFVPGQLVTTSEGEKFVPGQVIVEKSGPKFVPGQIIQTKNGATFIPGQMMNTNAGQKFVPGQLVETVDGPRFVPGQVLETAEGPKFVPGTVIETEEGLKFVPHEAEEAGEDIEIAFQGFEVTPEEMYLLTINPTDTRAHSPIANDQCIIDNRTLKRLASDTMEVHGATPEPASQPDKKKRKKMRKKVMIDASDEDESEEGKEDEEVDVGTDKLEIIKMLYNATNTVSNVRKSRELKKIGYLLGDETTFPYPIQTMAISKLLSSVAGEELAIVKAFIGMNDEIVNDIMAQISSVDMLTRNDEVKKLISSALQSVVTNKCNKEIAKIMKRLTEDPSSLMTDAKTQILLTEAVGIVCVTGNIEVASLLEKFISEPSDPSVLTDDPDVMTVLRQLIVLHEISERDEETAKMLQLLQTNPEGVKYRKQIREMLTNVNKLLILPSEYARSGKKFDVRHVASSRDIPAEVFEQIKADKEEAEKFLENLPDELFQAIMGDERCGNRVLEGLDQTSEKAKADISRFRQGMAVVVAQSSVQAVIPRRYARSVYYGIMPYLLIDEQGFKFFERGLTGRKLAPSKVIENTWCKDDDYYKRKILYTKSGERCSVSLMGWSTPSLQYTCLFPTSEPKIVTREALLQERRSSMSRRPSHDLSRKSSASSLHGGDYGYGTGYSPLSVAAYDPSLYMPNHIDPSGYGHPNSYVSAYTADPALSAYISDPSYACPQPVYSNGYDDPGMYGAVVPYEPPIIEAIIPVKRSDTVGRLLDKYRNFSTEREFYHKPTGVYSKYSQMLRGSNRNGDPFLAEDSDPMYDGNLDSVPYGKPKAKSGSKSKGGFETDVNSGYRFSNIYEEDEESGSPMKYGGSKTSRFLSPDSSVGRDRQSHLRSTDPNEQVSAGIQNKVKSASRFLSPEKSQSPLSDLKSKLVEDPFAPNVGYFDLGRFDDPIADRYARNISAYTLPSELDEKYGKSRYGNHSSIIDDPATYGMYGVSDYFTPNYTSKYSRYNASEPSYLDTPRRPKEFSEQSVEPERHRRQSTQSKYGGYTDDAEPQSYGKQRTHGYGESKLNGSVGNEDQDPKQDLSKRISRFLKPKEDGEKNGRLGGRYTTRSKYSSARDHVEPMERRKYGLGTEDIDSDEDLSLPSYRTPQKTYGSSRRMTTPGSISAYGVENNEDYHTPARYGSQNRMFSDTKDVVSPPFQEPSYRRTGGYRSDLGLDSDYENRKSSVRDIFSPGMDDISKRSYGSAAGRYGGGIRSDVLINDEGDYEGGLGRNPRSSMLRSGSYNPYSDLVGDEDRPWRRHTTVKKKTPYVVPLYGDDDDDDTGYNPKHTERQLASRIAKQYLGGRDQEDEEE